MNTALSVQLFWLTFCGGFVTGTAAAVTGFIAVKLFQWRKDRRGRGRA